ncbi:MAG: Hsp70 family protein [Rectinemataceae bacterium]
MSTIGIKLADGKFYPILDDGRPAGKRLVVTTVKDGQKSVQIDVYRGEGESVVGAHYMGSLVVDGIPEQAAGTPDVKLELELDDAGHLKARASVAGAEETTEVSLESLVEDPSYETPDFDIEEDRTDSLPEEGLASDDKNVDIDDDFEIPDMDSSSYGSSDDEVTTPEEGAGLLASASEIHRERHRLPTTAFVGGAVVLIVLCALLWMFLRTPAKATKAPGAATVAAKSVESKAQPAATAPAPKPAAAPAASAASPAAKTAATTAAPPAASAAKAVSTQTAPAAKPTAAPTKAAAKPAAAPAKAEPAPAGKRYRIKWGDTLWDIAWASYRDPWLYPRIVKANKLRNPDRIMAGTWIVIPRR